MMRALAEPAPVDTDVPIREWIANRLYSQLPPEHQIQPEPDPRCEECGKPFRGGRYCDECTAKFQAGENKR
jgi:hypothetical protein